MRECLREIAKLPLRLRVVFFRQQANIVAQREQTLEQGACFGIPRRLRAPLMKTTNCPEKARCRLDLVPSIR